MATIYCISSAEDGLLAAAETLELAQAAAEELTDDYFGKPLAWRSETEASYSVDGYSRALVTILSVELYSAPAEAELEAVCGDWPAPCNHDDEAHSYRATIRDV